MPAFDFGAFAANAFDVAVVVRKTRQLRMLQALKALAETALPGSLVRGFDSDAEMPRRITAGGCVIGYPGEPGEADVDWSPLTYTFRQRVDVEIAAPGSAGGDDLDQMLVALGAAVLADRTLGGVCEWVEAQAAERGSRTGEGVAVVNWALVPIVAEYVTASALGD